MNYVPFDYVESPLRKIVTPSTITKIKNFANLPIGWHHGKGIPPAKETINVALHVNQFARNMLFLTDAVPGLEGEIQLVVFEDKSEKDSYLEITIERDQSFNITRYDKNNDCWQISWDRDVTSLQDVKSEVNIFWREIEACPLSSGYSPNDIIMQTSDVSPASPLRSTKEEYPLYSKSVFQTSTHNYVYI